MEKVLVLASVASMIDQFNIPNIKLLIEMGYQVDVACNFIDGSTCSDDKIKMLQETLDNLSVKWYQIDFARNITNVQMNIKAFKQVKKLLIDKRYSFIHCHSPIGGLVGRLAARITKTKVVYTAHGFHFYKGSPLKNWFIYYPIEKICSYFTDVLICINKEDYKLAQRKMNAKMIEYVPGVGLDIEKYKNIQIDIDSKRQEVGIPKNTTLLLSVGELNKNKNHEVIICALAKLEDKSVHYVIAGEGKLKQYLIKLSKNLNVANRVHLLGYRNDVEELCKISDVFCFPSKREGLPVSLMEAMACGKPIICSNIRGNTDLVEDEKGGFLFDPMSIKEIEDALRKVRTSDLSKMGAINASIIKGFDLSTVMKDTKEIYSQISSDGA